MNPLSKSKSFDHKQDIAHREASTLKERQDAASAASLLTKKNYQYGGSSASTSKNPHLNRQNYGNDAASSNTQPSRLYPTTSAQDDHIPRTTRTGTSSTPRAAQQDQWRHPDAPAPHPQRSLKRCLLLYEQAVNLQRRRTQLSARTLHEQQGSNPYHEQNFSSAYLDDQDVARGRSRTAASRMFTPESRVRNNIFPRAISTSTIITGHSRSVPQTPTTNRSSSNVWRSLDEDHFSTPKQLRGRGLTYGEQLQGGLRSRSQPPDHSATTGADHPPDEVVNTGADDAQAAGEDPNFTDDPQSTNRTLQRSFSARPANTEPPSSGGGGATTSNFYNRSVSASRRARTPTFPNGYAQVVDRLKYGVSYRQSYNHPNPVIRSLDGLGGQSVDSWKPFSFGDGTSKSVHYPFSRKALSTSDDPNATKLLGSTSNKLGERSESPPGERPSYGDKLLPNPRLDSDTARQRQNLLPGPRKTEFLCEVVIPQKNRCAYKGRIKIRVRQGADLKQIAESHRRVYGLTVSQTEKLLRTLVVTRTQIQHGSFLVAQLTGGLRSGASSPSRRSVGQPRTSLHAGTSTTGPPTKRRSKSAPSTRPPPSQALGRGNNIGGIHGMQEPGAGNSVADQDGSAGGGRGDMNKTGGSPASMIEYPDQLTSSARASAPSMLLQLLPAKIVAVVGAESATMPHQQPPATVALPPDQVRDAKSAVVSVLGTTQDREDAVGGSSIPVTPPDDRTVGQLVQPAAPSSAEATQQAGGAAGSTAGFGASAPGNTMMLSQNKHQAELPQAQQLALDTPGRGTASTSSKQTAVEQTSTAAPGAVVLGHEQQIPASSSVLAPQQPPPPVPTAPPHLKVIAEGDPLRRLIFARILDLQLTDEESKEDIPFEQISRHISKEFLDQLLEKRNKSLLAANQAERTEKLQEFLTDKGLQWFAKQSLEPDVLGVHPGSVEEQAKSLNQGVFREFVKPEALPGFLLLQNPPSLELLKAYFRIWATQWTAAYFSTGKACPEFSASIGERTYARKVGRMLLDVIKAGFTQAVVFEVDQPQQPQATVLTPPGHQHSETQQPVVPKPKNPLNLKETESLLSAFCQAIVEQPPIVVRLSKCFLDDLQFEATRTIQQSPPSNLQTSFFDRLLVLTTMTLCLASSPKLWQRDVFAEIGQSDLALHPCVMKKIFDRISELRIFSTTVTPGGGAGVTGPPLPGTSTTGTTSRERADYNSASSLVPGPQEMIFPSSTGGGAGSASQAARGVGGSSSLEAAVPGGPQQLALGSSGTKAPQVVGTVQNNSTTKINPPLVLGPAPPTTPGER
ncbi:unnamed protein product [Amoebophrya sp. A120]|nr:unnamed protein product [Amoebophrya sp. A120]|eukprot:GSA120T00020749001.1